MKVSVYKIIFLVLFASITACSTGAGGGDVTVIIDTNNTISTGYIGNGVQWDAYSSNFGCGEALEVSDDDWVKLYDRVDNMAPGFIRVMANTANLRDKEGNFDPYTNMKGLARILDYCESRGVTVMFGDWGGNMVNTKDNTINKALLDNAVKYADFLINTKGYSCIKYYNLINEPNGWWSVTKGDYNLWSRAVDYFHCGMTVAGLESKLAIAGPDIAIWDDTETWWIDSCRNKANNAIGLYDIHTYPGKGEVNTGLYSDIIGAYHKQMPEGHKMIMGEIGLKFHAKDPVFDSINKARIAKVPHASESDSQMFVFDHFYGTDMADVLVQTLNEGFSGSLIWMLDDAMHTNPVDGPGKLKIWGFWNILGEERFGGTEHEKVRPPYYAWSLLCKYIPQESNILKTTTKGVNGLRVATIEKDGKHTIVVVNVTDETQKVTLKSKTLEQLEDIRLYNYIEGDMILEGDNKQLPNESWLNINLKKGYELSVPAASMKVYTNMNE